MLDYKIRFAPNMPGNILAIMILSYSHRLKQWVRFCENHKKVKFLWSYLANNHLMNPSAKGIEIILAHEKSITLIPIYIGIKYINESTKNVVYIESHCAQADEFKITVGSITTMT